MGRELFDLDRLKMQELRGVYKLSQPELAKLIKVSAATISNWERGKTKPNYATAGRLAEEFKVDLKDLRLKKPLQDIDKARVSSCMSNYTRYVVDEWCKLWQEGS